MADLIVFFTIASVIAAILVARGKALAANCIWAVSNVFIISHNVSICEWEMVFLFGAYECVAIYGIYYLWARKYLNIYMNKRRMKRIIKEYRDAEELHEKENDKNREVGGKKT